MTTYYERDYVLNNSGVLLEVKAAVGKLGSNALQLTFGGDYVAVWATFTPPGDFSDGDIRLGYRADSTIGTTLSVVFRCQGANRSDMKNLYRLQLTKYTAGAGGWGMDLFKRVNGSETNLRDWGLAPEWYTSDESTYIDVRIVLSGTNIKLYRSKDDKMNSDLTKTWTLAHEITDATFASGYAGWFHDGISTTKLLDDFYVMTYD
jgi:hypothetical protein